MKKKFVLIVIAIFVLGLVPVKATNAGSLKGKILLQVEQNGEAWYVNPGDNKRYFLGRPDDAFGLMRRLGVGITNSDLNKIQIADSNLAGGDSDGDGLSDMVEDSIGTNKNKKDTDGDGYNDKDEIIGGYSPVGKVLNLDISFASKQAGKILLQVEQNGEAWYVNPGDNKRYFLGRPNDAFNLMRSLGLGITDSNLSQISENRKYYPSEVLCGGLDSTSGVDFSGLTANCDSSSITKLDNKYYSLKAVIGSHDIVLFTFNLPKSIEIKGGQSAKVYLNRVWCNRENRIAYSSNSGYQGFSEYSNTKYGSFVCQENEIAANNRIGYDPIVLDVDIIDDQVKVLMQAVAFTANIGDIPFEVDEVYLVIE